jgi:hypothetical protein
MIQPNRKSRPSSQILQGAAMPHEKFTSARLAAAIAMAEARS